ncbi:hypothetical protein [Jiella mangrovi]|uniref:DUF3618 domain-containing protein n=1 Tax=Jiella mangrovi TaxID=2821407 RepID=A0ABS4BC21_9HYPH|nr:hypothetical protein [Jiella mangrovi]MBP0614298.1 hypothetical protein [Jiella mangrovi]
MEIDMSEAELQKTLSEIDKLQAETRKLVAEAGKLKVETFLYPFIASATLIGATAAAMRLLLG